MSDNITKQGKSVLECFEESPDVHFTAEDVSEKLKKKDNPVSTATIYRQLEKLTAMGIIRKYISSPDEPACYQFHGGHSECAHHFHLKCVSCNKLIHVSCEYLNEIEHHVKEHHGFKIDNTRTVLYGICEECSKGKSKDE